MNIMLHVRPWKKLDALKIMSAKTVRVGKATMVLHREPGKGISCPLGGEGKVQGGETRIDTKQNNLARSIVEKYLPVADWIESVISINLNMGP